MKHINSIFNLRKLNNLKYCNKTISEILYFYNIVQKWINHWYEQLCEEAMKLNMMTCYLYVIVLSPIKPFLKFQGGFYEFCFVNV